MKDDRVAQVDMDNPLVVELDQRVRQFLFDVCDTVHGANGPETRNHPVSMAASIIILLGRQLALIDMANAGVMVREIGNEILSNYSDEGALARRINALTALCHRSDAMANEIMQNLAQALREGKVM